MPEDVRVFIVDDDLAVLDSMAHLVRSQGLQSEVFASAEAFLNHYSPEMRGCLVLDLRLPGISGADLQQALKARGSSLPIIFVTGHGSVPSCVQALQNGAVTFLEKPFQPAVLLASIHEALSLENRERCTRSHRDTLLARLRTLTSAEREVFEGLVRGMTNQEMADGLSVSIRTVQFRRARVLKKFNVRARQEIMNLILEAGGLQVLSSIPAH